MGNIPHLVKKVVNCLEMSGNHKSKRHLVYEGVHINLARLHKIWLQSRRGTKIITNINININNNKNKSLARPKLSNDCYIKNPNN